MTDYVSLPTTASKSTVSSHKRGKSLRDISNISSRNPSCCSFHTLDDMSTSQFIQTNRVNPVLSFLTALGLEQYFYKFEEHSIAMCDLKTLTRDDLVEMELPIGPRNKILSEIETLDMLGSDDCITD